MKLINCISCNKDKHSSEFYIDHKSKSGYRSSCKECGRLRKESYFRTEEGLITKIYSGQKSSSKNRGHHPPEYSKRGLKVWLYDNDFSHIFDMWVEGGFRADDKPSVDRIDDTKRYSYSNIQLMTWGENKRKPKMLQELKVQCVKNTGEVVLFRSMTEASLVTGFHNTSISSWVNGLVIPENKWKWSYDEFNKSC